MKGLLVINSATPALSWTKIKAEALTGAGSIETKRAVGWTIGDRVVIASSTKKEMEYEIRTISAISGNTLSLNAGLTHNHYGGN